MIAVAVCTYKRPQDLARLLEAFAALRVPAGTAFVVVDNHGDDPRVGELVSGFGTRTGWTVRYVVEREPGISAARNAAVRAVRALGATTMAMLDDDEWPPASWIEALVAARDQAGAKVVGGPVRPVFSENRADLRRHARFWSVEADFLHGKPFVYCTCNFLLELEAIDFLGERPFDPAFGITGGGDTVFFRSIFNTGAPMAWSEDAWISEEIPDSRASVDWLRKRRYRMGNVAYRWEKETPAPNDMNPDVKTLLAVARLPFYPFMSREKSDRGLAWLLEFDKVRGRVAAQFGSRYSEYARPGTATTGAEPDGKACR